MAHLHEIEDRDPYFVIDPDTRIIKNMSATKTVLAKNDHNSEIFTFGIPREVDGHDMWLCDTIQIHYLIGGVPGMHEVDLDKDRELVEATEEGEEDIMLVSWLVSRNATQAAGPLSFAITYLCTHQEEQTDPVSGQVDNVTVVDYCWSTFPHTGINVGDTLNASAETEEEYREVLLNWYAKLTAIYGDIEGSKTDAIEAIKAAKDEAVVAAQAEITTWVQDSESEVMTELQKTFSEDFQALEDEVAGLKDVLGAGDESVTGLVDRVITLEEKVETTLEPGVDYAAVNIPEIYHQISNLDSNVESLRTDLTSVDERVANLHQTLFDGESTGEETTGLVGKVNELIADVESIETTLGGETTGLVDKVNSMETDKVDKFTESSQLLPSEWNLNSLYSDKSPVTVYARDKSGNEVGVHATWQNQNGGIVMRKPDGSISASTANPGFPTDVVNVDYFKSLTGVNPASVVEVLEYKNGVKPSLQTQINNITAAMPTVDYLNSKDTQSQMRMLLGSGYDSRVVFKPRNYVGPVADWKWYKAISMLLSDGSDWIVTETRDDHTEGARVYIKGEEADDNIQLSVDGTYHYIPVIDEDGFEVGEATLTPIPWTNAQTIDGKFIYHSTASSSRYIAEDPWASKQYMAITAVTVGAAGVEYPTELYIPYQYAGAPVTTIDSDAFMNCPYIEIYIPDSVTTIGINVFKSSPVLRKVHLSSNIGTIYRGTFVGCPNLKTLTIPRWVLQIEDGAFDEHLESLYIDRPEGSIAGAPWGATNATITYKED